MWYCACCLGNRGFVCMREVVEVRGRALVMWRRGERVASFGYGSDDVQAWIRSVEASSDLILNKPSQDTNSRSVTEDDEINNCYQEAHDLLQSWTKDKKKDGNNSRLNMLDPEDGLLLDTTLDRQASGALDRAHKVLHDCDSERRQYRPHKTAWSSGVSSLPPHEDHSSLFRPASSLLSHRDAFSHAGMSEETVEDVLERMRNVSLDRVSADVVRKPPRVNPLHTMDMRHKQVKERREARETARRTRLAEQAAKKDARRVAEQILMKEQQQKVEKLKYEDALIQREMTVLRRELESKRKEKMQQIVRDKEIKHQAETQMQQAGQQQSVKSHTLKVKSEREKKIEETRRVLVSQLEIATAEEAKENLRTLKCHFSAWYSLIVYRHVQLGKARAVADWRCLLKIWNKWRAYILNRQSEKEAECLAEQMKREHRNGQVAAVFGRHLYLRRCFSAWQTWTRRRVEKKELENVMDQHRQKMSALLEAAATGALWSDKNPYSTEKSPSSSDSDDNQQDDPQTITSKNSNPQRTQTSGSHPLPVEGQLRAVHLITTKKAKEHLTKVLGYNPDMIQRNKSEPHRDDSKTVVQRRNTIVTSSAAQTASVDSNPSTNLSSRLRPQSTTGGESGVDVKMESSMDNAVSMAAVALLPKQLPLDKVLAGPKAVNKVVRKPVRPVGLKGMESRTAQITERREARMQRMKELEEEKLAKLKAEEKERREQEEAEKLAKIEAKREEKRLAKQREIEKQNQLQILARQTAQAEDHYQKSLMMTYGLAPWKHLISIAKHNEHRASNHSNQVLMTKCFVPWQQTIKETIQEKEKEADSLYRDLLLKRHFSVWQEFVGLQYGLEAAADAHSETSLARKMLAAWHRFVTNEQLERMAKEEKADELYKRLLKQRVVMCWRQFVPLAKEEKLAETRRNLMRQRVTDWLPDFKPTLDTSQ